MHRIISFIVEHTQQRVLTFIERNFIPYSNPVVKDTGGVAEFIIRAKYAVPRVICMACVIYAVKNMFVGILPVKDTPIMASVSLGSSASQ